MVWIGQAEDKIDQVAQQLEDELKVSSHQVLFESVLTSESGCRQRMRSRIAGQRSEGPGL